MKRKISPIILTLIFISIFFSLAGCASQFFEVKVGYDLQNEIKAPVLDNGKISLYVERFSDVRGNIVKNVVGEAKTGAFDKKTPILIEDSDIEEVSTKGFREAFSKAGFNVILDEKNADLIFRGRISKFWLQEFVNFWAPTQRADATIEFDVALFDRISKKNLWFDVKNNVSSKITGADVTDFDEAIMNEAFNNVIISVLKDKEFTSEINNFMNSKK